jgi:hypothetical protein
MVVNVSGMGLSRSSTAPDGLAHANSDDFPCDNTHSRYVSPWRNLTDATQQVGVSHVRGEAAQASLVLSNEAFILDVDVDGRPFAAAFGHGLRNRSVVLRWVWPSFGRTGHEVKPGLWRLSDCKCEWVGG